MLHRLATDFVAGIRRRLESLGLPVVRSRAASFGVQDNANKQFLQCIQFSDRGEFDQARDCYQKVLQINPRHAKTHNNLGIIYHRDGNLEDGNQDIDRKRVLLPGCSFFSLQKGAAEKHVATLNDTRRKMMDYTSDLKNFSDTAAFIAALDLVITIDTAVAHLAGALAKPVWVMLPFSPDWRWSNTITIG